MTTKTILSTDTTVTDAKNVPCGVCSRPASHLAIRADESSYPVCPDHAKQVRRILSRAGSTVNVGTNPHDTVRLMTRTALYRRWIQMDERYTRSWKFMRAVLASRTTSYAKERQAEDRYIDACHKFDLAVLRCRAMGMSVDGLV